MRSSNPMLRENIISEAYAISDRPMTVAGSMNKFMILTLLLLVAAGAVYYQFSLKHFDYVNMLTWGGLITGFILAIVISFKRDWAPFLAPLYAFAEGAALSGISCFVEARYPGIVIQAVSITFLTAITMALLYKLRIIRVTSMFTSVLFTAMTAIFIFYLISIVMALFGLNVPYFTSNSPLAIIINIVIAGVAAFSLILDYHFIERGSNAGLPSYFEWYGAFGLMVTLVWLYIEILRILSRFNDR